MSRKTYNPQQKDLWALLAIVKRLEPISHPVLKKLSIHFEIEVEALVILIKIYGGKFK